MSVTFSREECCLFALLQSALNGGCRRASEFPGVSWAKVLSAAQKHTVLSLLYDVFEEESRPDQCWQEYVAPISRKTVYQSYRLLFLTRYVAGLLEKHQVPAVVLKGVTAAVFYPVPELRKSGDVDIMIPSSANKKLIRRIMEDAGFRVSDTQHANHHLVWISPDGIDVELHVMVAEPFAYEKINGYLRQKEQEFLKNTHRQEIMGVSLPMLDLPYQAFQLLLHMLQHFLYAGFGLKLLCDWAVLWNQPWTKEEKELFAGLARESGVERFAELITASCVEFLGMSPQNVSFMLKEDSMAAEFMKEVMEAEEFGKGSGERMVMMQGSSLTDYIREFHHQMHLNYPKAGRILVCWPALWIMTLIRFLRNNRKLRNVSTIKVLKKAGSRSKLMEKLRLFEQ